MSNISTIRSSNNGFYRELRIAVADVT